MLRRILAQLIQAGRRDLAVAATRRQFAAEHTYFVWLTGDLSFNRKAVSQALRQLHLAYRTVQSDPPGYEVEIVRDSQLVLLQSKIELARLQAGRDTEVGWKIEPLYR